MIDIQHVEVIKDADGEILTGFILRGCEYFEEFINVENTKDWRTQKLEMLQFFTRFFFLLLSFSFYSFSVFLFFFSLFLFFSFFSIVLICKSTFIIFFRHIKLSYYWLDGILRLPIFGLYF